MRDEERPIGVLVAVREEMQAVSRRLAALSCETVDGLRIERGLLAGVPVALARSGMGAARAARAADALIRQCSPRLLVVAGFAASLDEALAPGAVVVATRVREAPAGAPAPGRGSDVLTPDADILARACAVFTHGMPARSGELLTVGAVVRTAHEKADLARAHAGAVAFDMETAPAVRTAMAAGVPWLAVRAVTDGPRDDLPLDFSALTDPATGEVAPARIAATLLCRPWTIPGLVRLGGRAGLAARNLAAFIEAFLGEPGDGETGYNAKREVM